MANVPQRPAPPHAHVPAEAEHLSARERRMRLHVREAAGEFEDALSPLEDDVDALSLGPTGSDGNISDPDIARVFKEEQIGHGEMSGRDRAWQQVRAHVGLDPELRTGDMDASLEDANFVGEEGIGGSMVPPDASDVDEIGRAVGVHYQDNEPLDMQHKVDQRDEDRWELDPASAEDWATRQHREEHDRAQRKTRAEPTPPPRR
jgi:hypothetical protein